MNSSELPSLCSSCDGDAFICSSFPKGSLEDYKALRYMGKCIDSKKSSAMQFIVLSMCHKIALNMIKGTIPFFITAEYFLIIHKTKSPDYVNWSVPLEHLIYIVMMNKLL